MTAPPDAWIAAMVAAGWTCAVCGQLATTVADDRVCRCTRCSREVAA
jgi:DNA-directed RNA polymerase subunit RPC12/RpoP